MPVLLRSLRKLRYLGDGGRGAGEDQQSKEYRQVKLGNSVAGHVQPSLF
jgi:hypothetical protein